MWRTIELSMFIILFYSLDCYRLYCSVSWQAQNARCERIEKENRAPARLHYHFSFPFFVLISSRSRARIYLNIKSAPFCENFLTGRNVAPFRLTCLGARDTVRRASSTLYPVSNFILFVIRIPASSQECTMLSTSRKSRSNWRNYARSSGSSNYPMIVQLQSEHFNWTAQCFHGKIKIVRFSHLLPVEFVVWEVRQDCWSVVQRDVPT